MYVANPNIEAPAVWKMWNDAYGDGVDVAGLRRQS